MANMKLPKGHGGFNIGGAQYKPNKNGIVEDVDPAHLVGAQEHGAVLDDPDGGDGGSEIEYSSMKVGQLRTLFQERFPEIDGSNAPKAELIAALEGGWNVFGIGELRGAYKKRFDVVAPDELKKSDLVEAMNAETIGEE